MADASSDEHVAGSTITLPSPGCRRRCVPVRSLPLRPHSHRRGCSVRSFPPTSRSCAGRIRRRARQVRASEKGAACRGIDRLFVRPRAWPVSGWRQKGPPRTPSRRIMTSTARLAQRIKSLSTRICCATRISHRGRNSAPPSNRPATTGERARRKAHWASIHYRARMTATGLNGHLGGQNSKRLGSSSGGRVASEIR